jgi:hypothetical protein
MYFFFCETEWDWATGWVTGVPFLVGAGIFSLRHRVQTGCGARSASYPVGTWGLRGWLLKLTTSPFRDEIKNAWGCTSTPPVRVDGVVLVKHRDSFTFFLIGNRRKRPHINIGRI